MVWPNSVPRISAHGSLRTDGISPSLLDRTWLPMLIAYYIHKHMVLPNIVIEGIEPGGRGEWTKEHVALQDLAEVQPRAPTVVARIRVSREVCKDCRRFVSHVEEKLGISLWIEPC